LDGFCRILGRPGPGCSAFDEVLEKRFSRSLHWNGYRLYHASHFIFHHCFPKVSKIILLFLFLLIFVHLYIMFVNLTSTKFIIDGGCSDWVKYAELAQIRSESKGK
jgi:hypothetical protein